MNFRVYVRPRNITENLPRLEAASRVTIPVPATPISPANSRITCENTRAKFGWMRSDAKWSPVFSPAQETPILGAVLQKLVGQSLALQWQLNRAEKLDYAIDAGRVCVLVRHTNPTVSQLDTEWWEPMVLTENGRIESWRELVDSPHTSQINAVLATAVLKLVEAEVMMRREFGVRPDLRFGDFYKQVSAANHRIGRVRNAVLPFLPGAGSTHKLRFNESGKRLLVLETLTLPA